MRTIEKRKTMKVCRVLVVSVVLSVLSLWLYFADAQQSRPEVLPPGVSRTPVLEASRVPSPAQQKSLKEQLVGTWVHISSPNQICYGW